MLKESLRAVPASLVVTRKDFRLSDSLYRWAVYSRAVEPPPSGGGLRVSVAGPSITDRRLGQAADGPSLRPVELPDEVPAVGFPEKAEGFQAFDEAEVAARHDSWR